MAAHDLFSALPKFRRGAFGLFLIVVALSAILADQPIAARLLLQPATVLRGEGLWQPLTANFIYPEGSVGFVIGTFVVQWFIGSDLEGFWGTRKYLLLAIGCGLAGYLFAVLLAAFVPSAAVPMGGAVGMDLAAVTAFGVVYGNRRLRALGAFPLSAKTLCILVIALSLVAPLARGVPWPKVVPWAIAVLAALLTTTQPWRRLRDSGKLGASKSKRKRNHLKVVRPDRELLN